MVVLADKACIEKLVGTKIKNLDLYKRHLHINPLSKSMSNSRNRLKHWNLLVTLYWVL